MSADTEAAIIASCRAMGAYGIVEYDNCGGRVYVPRPGEPTLAEKLAGYPQNSNYSQSFANAAIQPESADA